MIGEYIFGAIVVAIIYSLVRPGSPAAGAVQTISNALIAVVGTATGTTTIPATSGPAPVWPPVPGGTQ